MGVYDDMMRRRIEESRSKEVAQSGQPEETQQKASSPSNDQLIAQSTKQSIKPSTDQSTGRSTNRLLHQRTHPSSSKVMDKPRAFYITEQVNKRIDEAVAYYQEKHKLAKVDRSIVVTALLEKESNWTEKALDLLMERVINQLTSRLLNR
jgi:hypothetical protein